MASVGVLLTLLSSASSFASEPVPAQLKFPGEPLSRSIVQLQIGADQLYEQARFSQALEIYRDRLAPIGDKYAQYMVGYLHQQGQGMVADPVNAYAWLRLAAQRGDPTLLAAMEQQREALSTQQIAQGEQTYQVLNASLGDLALLRKLIRVDQDCVRSGTGSRVGGERPRRVFGNDCHGKGGSETKQRLKDRKAYLRDYREVGAP